MLPFMQVLENGETKYVREVTAALVSHFQLTDGERHALLPSGQQSLFSNRVGWAKSHLKNAGLSINPARGRVAISELGREVLRTKPTEINCKLLKQ